MSHKLTPFSASKTDLAQQYWLPSFIGQLDVMKENT